MHTTKDLTRILCLRTSLINDLFSFLVCQQNEKLFFFFSGDHDNRDGSTDENIALIADEDDQVAVSSLVLLFHLHTNF